MDFVINKANIEKVMSYLSARPFIEVAELMKMLSSLKILKKEEEKEEK